MGLPGKGSGWWDAAARTLLPHRGALANARSAVRHDEWAAERRRTEGRLVRPASPIRHDQDTPGFLLPEPAWAAVADVTPHPGFAAAAEDALHVLHDRFGLDLWMVTTVRDGMQRPLVAVGAGGMPVPPGAVQPWAESYCQLMVAGLVPRAAPRAREVDVYAARPPTTRWQVAAYLGVPLLGAHGRLFGTLCGLSATEQPDSLVEALPDAERLARLLGTVLQRESAALEQSRAAAEAHTLADRDPVTGLLNRRGWASRLASEDRRCERHGRTSAVLVVDLARGGEPAPADAHLTATARLLTRTFRATDVVARTGSSEISVLAVECPARSVPCLADRVQDLLDRAGPTLSLEVTARSTSVSLPEAWRAASARLQQRGRARR